MPVVQKMTRLTASSKVQAAWNSHSTAHIRLHQMRSECEDDHVAPMVGLHARIPRSYRVLLAETPNKYLSNIKLSPGASEHVVSCREWRDINIERSFMVL